MHRIYMAFAGLLLAAATGFSTQQARTAAPGSVNLAGVSATEGSSLAFARADHTHSITGAVPDANIAGPYSGVGSCAASRSVTALTRNAAPTCTQTAFSDLSGTAVLAQIPTAAIVNAGTLAYTTSQTATLSSAGRVCTCSHVSGASGAPTSCSVSGSTLTITHSGTGTDAFVCGVANAGDGF